MGYLRPDLDDLDGNWTDQAAGLDLSAVLDETSADDADFARSGDNPSNDIMRVRLSDPSGTVDTAQPVTVRYRYSKSGVDTLDLVVRLKEGTTVIASWTHSGVAETWATAEQVLTTEQKAAITDWSNLFLEFDASLGGVADAYAVQGFSPELVADFLTETYRKHGWSGIKFEKSAGTGPYRIMDGGVEKWAPHNLISRSEDFLNTWGAIGVTRTAKSISFLGSSSSDRAYMPVTVSGTVTVTFDIYFDPTDVGKQVDLGIWTTVLNGLTTGRTASKTIPADGKVSHTWTNVTDITAVGIITSTGTPYTVNLASNGGVHLYRSDQNGMADNPARGDSYVPTTTAAVYHDDGMFTYTGASLKTMVDSDGYVKWAPHNLLRYSEDLTNSVWTKTNATVTANAAIAPDGTTTADLLEATGASGDSFVFQSYTGYGDSVVTSVYVKRGTSDWFCLSNTSFFAYFNIANGTLGTIQSGTASITDAGNGWWLIEWTQTTGISAIRLRNVAANGSSSIAGGEQTYIWGAHVYRVDLPMVDNPDRGDSYVPTTTAAVYLPRRGHNNEGLLLESEARTNLFANAVGSKSFATGFISNAGILSVVADNADSPGGSLTATQVIIDTGNTQHRLWTGVNGGTVAASTEYTTSFFAKQIGTQCPFLFVFQDATNVALGNGACFDLSTGTATINGTVRVNGEQTIAAGMEDYGNGWWRCWMRGKSGTLYTSSNHIIVFRQTSGFTYETFVGDGLSGAFFFGFQFEQASTPSSYIPTNGATVTRAAETLTIPAENVTASTTGVSLSFHGSIDPFVTISNVDIVTWPLGGSTLNEISLQFDQVTTSAGQLEFWAKYNNNNVDIVTTTTTYYNIAGVRYLPISAALRSNPTAINLAVDGVALTEDNTILGVPLVSGTAISFGDLDTFFGTIGKFCVWQSVDLGNAGIAEASTP